MPSDADVPHGDKAGGPGLKGIRISEGNPRDPDPFKRGPYARVTNNGIPSDPVPLKDNPVLAYQIDHAGLDVLSLLTADKCFQAEVFGLFRRRHGDYLEDRLRESFVKSMKRLTDAKYVVIRPRDNSDYSVAEEGIDAVLELFDTDAFEWEATDLGLEMYYSFGPDVDKQT